jgi:hypothetical protein
MIEGKAQITKKDKTTTIIKVPAFQPTWTDYKNLYPVKTVGKKVFMYKTVHKATDGTYFADYDKNYKYEIGKTHELENDSSTSNSCSYGLHVSHKSWALSFGASWNDCALLECEVNPKDIVVSKDCDGKVRTSKLTVIREVPKEEWYTLDMD